MGVEEKVKAMIAGSGNMTRQQRRQLERSGAKFDHKQLFTKDEVTAANAAAYEYGKQLSLQATKEVMGLGPKRMARIDQVLKQLEFDTFIKPFEGGNNSGK